jgi:serine/threonine protein kinase
LTNTAFDKFVGITVGNYHLERFIGQSNLGPAFFTRTDSATTCQLCFLAGPEPRDRQAYLERFQSQARQVAALQHQYILPLLDYGVYRGIPYLVTPHIPLRSLRARVDKNGPLDVSTIGRYLDQIATALEYAHEHGILHERLSVDNIFIKLDGNLVIGDFGTAQFLDPGQRTTSQEYLYGKGEAYAPEQLLGKRAGTYTDVYALGVVLYYLLTGSPVFSGGATKEIAQEHLYGVVPPLNRSRGDLPPGLYSIIARALAKEPAQRFHKPGALANAYHRVVAPNNRTRVPIVVSTALPDQMVQPLNADCW